MSSSSGSGGDGKGSGWYPGKFIKERRKSTSSVKDDEMDSSNSSLPSGSSSASSPAYKNVSSSTSPNVAPTTPSGSAAFSSTAVPQSPSTTANVSSSSSTSSTSSSTTTTSSTAATTSSSMSSSSSISQQPYNSSIDNSESKPKPYQRETSIDSTKKTTSQDIPKAKEKKSSTSSTSKDSTPWYPGKNFGRKPPSWAAASSSVTPTRRSSMPISGSAPVQIVGNLIIKVLGAKYMSATRPNFEVWVGSQCETFHYISLDISNGSTNETFEGKFPVGDIASDVFILIKEEYSVGGVDNFIGRIVIPISSYVTPKGPKPPKLEWMAIYPVMNLEDPMGYHRFGLPFLPGSAITKTKHSLGFLAVEVQLLLTPGPVYSLYLQGEPPKKMLRTLAAFAAETNDEPNQPTQEKKFNPEEMIRTYLRIQKYLTTPPAVLSPVVKFPEVFILIALYGFLCFGADAHHIPVILFFVVLINGFLSSSEKKNFTGRILWNSLIDSRKISNSSASSQATTKSLTPDQLKSSEYLLQALNEPLADAQQDLERMINKLEVLANIWNFSDLQVSMLFYGVFFGLAIVSSIVIYLFSIRPILFLLGTIYLLLNSIREYFPELMTASIPDQDANRENFMHTLRYLTTKFWMLLERVPSDPVLEHRHIARTCVVEDEGIEMKDAAAKKVM